MATAADPLEIAQAVIVSAGNILSAAGFGKAEIAAFLRQAADQLDPDAPAPTPVPAAPSHEPPASVAEGIRARLAASPPIRTVARLAAQAAALGPPPDSPEALRGAFDLAMQAIPPIAEAQGWLRTAARDAGLTLIAGDSAQSGPEVLRLGDFDGAWEQGFDLIGTVAGVLADRRDEEALQFLLVQLVDNDIAVSQGLKQAMESAVSRLSART